MKPLFVFLGLALTAGVALFWQDVLAVFRGMTVLESMKFIVTFILHVAAGTIAAYVLYTLPEIVNPWLRALKKSRRNGHRKTAVKIPAPRMTTDQLLRAYIMAQMQKRSTKSEPVMPGEDIRIEF